MNYHARSAFLLLVVGGFFLLAIPAAAFAQGPVQAVVSIQPQKYFVDKIGGKLVETEVMAPPGAIAERYEPRPRQMAALSRSKVYFACGIMFESVWLPKIREANRDMLVVDTGEWIARRRMEAHSHGDEQTAPEGKEEAGHAHHEREGMEDPHIWLSPPLVMIQARHIMDGLARVDPANKKAYEENYRSFVSELAALDSEILDLFAAKPENRAFMVFHPAWGYFADAYGLQQVPVEIEGKEPRPRDLEDFIKKAKELKVKVIFVQPQFSEKSARTIAEAVGARVAPADDLAGDWANNLREVARQISGAM